MPFQVQSGLAAVPFKLHVLIVCTYMHTYQEAIFLRAKSGRNTEAEEAVIPVQAGILKLRLGAGRLPRFARNVRDWEALVAPQGLGVGPDT